MPRMLCCCVMMSGCAGTLVGRLAAVSEQVEGLQSSLQQKADRSSVQEAKQQVREVRQQGESSSQSLADLHISVRQQGQEQATGLHRLEALIATVSQGENNCCCTFALSFISQGTLSKTECFLHLERKSIKIVQFISFSCVLCF